MPKKLKRPDMLRGMTRRVTTGCGKMYVTANFTEDGKLCEILTNAGKSGGCMNVQIQTICMLISNYIQIGGSPDELLHMLKGGTCHAHNSESPMSSCSDAIGKVVEKCIAQTAREMEGGGDAVS